MRKSKRRILSMMLALVLCFSALPVTAFAGGGPEDGSDKVLEYWSQDSTPQQPDQQTGQPSTPPAAQQPKQGEPLAEGSGFSTRDLLYDKHTNKQFITVQTSGGATFYIVIDYDKPVDEDGEQYQTYFLNTVDEADLLAAAEAAGVELASCSCSDKCAAGAVNTDCAVCAVNMTKCAGVEPEPEPEPVAEPDAEPEPETDKGNAGMLLLVLTVLYAFLSIRTEGPAFWTSCAAPSVSCFAPTIL